ncbi:MAG: DUF72 domain-containing protein [Cytophagaceae bacterium]|nr:DUF72 domain-containing protein [Cytophagaceae bacterium]
MKSYVGCSGYNYREWKGKFYPADLPQSKWLEYYTRHYNTIEINASFYKMPTEKGLQKWYNGVPEDFKFSIKANKIITHYRRFKNTEEQIKIFYEAAEKGLRDKLSCVLFQFPPSFKYEPEVLENIINQLSDEFTNVLEFRHASWWNEKVYSALKKKKIIFCSVSIENLSEELIKTSPVSYIRFHGKPELYKSPYSNAELKKWAENIKEQKFKENYIYFNNTWFLAALENAVTLQKML